MRASVILLVVVVLPAAASPDEIFLKSGGQLSGRIVSRTPTTVEIDVGAGRIGLAMSGVLRIEEGRSPLHEFEDRAAKLPAGDVDGWLALGDWASARGLGTQAREAYQRALSASPGNARANTALGNVQVGGRWVSEDEGYQARGYVRFEGEWITPAEHQAILSGRAADAQQESARQAEARAREAETRAEEAEARAQAAEAKAAEDQWSDNGIPLWYAWGAGPVSWSNSIGMRPVARPLPVRR